MTGRFWFGLNCFGVGVFFGLLGCRLDATLATRTSAWVDIAAFLLLAMAAALSVPGRA